MAISNSAYKIVLRAAQIRISRGEDGYEVVASYSKLSDDQRDQLIKDLIDSGYLQEKSE